MQKSSVRDYRGPIGDRGFDVLLKRTRMQRDSTTVRTRRDATTTPPYTSARRPERTVIIKPFRRSKESTT